MSPNGDDVNASDASPITGVQEDNWSGTFACNISTRRSSRALGPGEGRWGWCHE